MEVDDPDVSMDDLAPAEKCNCDTFRVAMNAALQEAERLRRQLKSERDGRATKAAAADTKWAEAVKRVERKYDELDASTDEDVAQKCFPWIVPKMAAERL